MNNTAKVKGIIFDLDGTLYRMPWYMKPLLTIKLLPHILWLPTYMSVREKFAGKDMINGDALMNELSNELSKKVPSLTPQKARSWIFDDFYKQFESVMPLFKGHRPFLAQTLEKCKSCGIKLAVLSDFDRVENRLKKLDISPALFDTLRAAEADGHLKPSPQSFLFIAKEWSISPENVMVIGDRDDTDGLAARGAKMQFLQICDSKKLKKQTHSWIQIRDILNSFCQEFRTPPKSPEGGLPCE